MALKSRRVLVALLPIFSEGNWKALIEPDTKALTNVREIIDDIFAPLDGNLPNIPQGNLPSPTRTTRTLGGKSGGKSGGGSRAGRESQVPALERELALAKELEPLYGRIAEAKLRGDEETVIRLQGEQALLELKKKQADIDAEKIPEAEKLLKTELLGLEVKKQILDTTYELKELEQSRKEAIEGIMQPIEDEIEMLQARLNGNEDEIKQLQEIKKLREEIAAAGGDPALAEGLIRQRDELKAQVKSQQELKDMAMDVAGSISGAFTGAFQDIITGSKSAQEALSNAFQKIGEAFLDMAMQIIQKQLTMIVYGLIMKALGVSTGTGAGGFGSGSQAPITNTSDFAGAFNGSGFGASSYPGLANGGTLLAGQPTIVGERGPELVTATQTANVRSNETMGSYMPTNSMMGPASSQPISVNYNVTEINSMRFVTEDQMLESSRRAATEGAKMGEMRTMASLKNNRSSRSRIGL